MKVDWPYPSITCHMQQSAVIFALGQNSKMVVQHGNLVPSDIYGRCMPASVNSTWAGNTSIELINHNASIIGLVHILHYIFIFTLSTQNVTSTTDFHFALKKYMHIMKFPFTRLPCDFERVEWCKDRRQSSNASVCLNENDINLLSCALRQEPGTSWLNIRDGQTTRYTFPKSAYRRYMPATRAQVRRFSSGMSRVCGIGAFQRWDLSPACNEATLANITSMQVHANA